MPPQIFKGRVIAAAGPLPGQFTVDNLKQWTKLRKGRFSEVFEEDVTHLLCTQEQFDKRVPIIKTALKHRKDVDILHYDWFEYSTVANKKLPEREYSMRASLAQKNAERRELARIERGRREGERGVNTTLFHVYYDEEYFPYQVDITRDDAEAGDFGQRHTLTLWESNARPHLYWFTAKFLRKKGDSQPNFYRPSRCSGVFKLEMGHFGRFFRVKTGVEWQDRVMRQGTQPGSYFQYSPPAGGKPVGGNLRFSYEYCVKINEELRASMTPAKVIEDKPEAEQMSVQKDAGNLDTEVLASGIACEDSVGEVSEVSKGSDTGSPDEAKEVSTQANIDSTLNSSSLEVTAF